MTNLRKIIIGILFGGALIISIFIGRSITPETENAIAQEQCPICDCRGFAKAVYDIDNREKMLVHPINGLEAKIITDDKGNEYTREELDYVKNNRDFIANELTK